MHTVVETNQFQKRSKALRITPNEVTEIITTLAQNPNSGDSLGGGLHKVRIANQSGGYRVLYFYKPQNMPLFLLTIFAKSEKDNISQAEKNVLIELCNNLTQTYRSQS